MRRGLSGAVGGPCTGGSVRQVGELRMDITHVKAGSLSRLPRLTLGPSSSCLFEHKSTFSLASATYLRTMTNSRKKTGYYAVAIGRQPGIYVNW